MLAAVAGMALAAPAGATDVPGCAPPAAGGDWPLYGGTLDNHREQLAPTAISKDSAGDLGLAWKTAMPDGGVIQSTPTVVDGCVFTGTDKGEAYAFNADTGQKVWGTTLKGGGGNPFVGAGVIGAPAIANGLVYVSATKDGSSILFALDEITGEIVWSKVINADPGGGADSSPVPFNGMVFQAYQGDESHPNSNPGYAIVDGSREGGGQILVENKVIPAEDFAKGDRGGSITSTPALDLDHNLLYAATGNPANGHQNPITNSLVKIDIDPASPTFGKILGSRRGDSESYPAPQDVDSPTCTHDLQWPAGPLSCVHTDMDFLASPNLFTDSQGRQLEGALQKSGVYHAVATADMSPAWKATLGPSCLGCNLSSTAVDEDAVYVAVSGGNLYALDKDTGAIKWAVGGTGGTHFNGLTVANGVLFSNNDAAGALQAFDTANGAPLLFHSFAQDTNAPMNDSGNSSGIAVARDTVFASSKSGSTSTLFALKPGAGGGGGGGLPPVPEPPGGAPGAGGRVVSGPGAANYGYLTPVATTTVGGELTYTNEDISRHDVIADERGADGQPLFSSALAGLNETVPVTGTDRVQAGRQYAFHCSLHPGMHGTLVVQ